MSGGLRLTLDDAEMRQWLDRLDEPGVVKILRDGIRKGAKVIVGGIRAQAPVKGRMGAGAHGVFRRAGRKSGVRGTYLLDYGTPGGLRASVKARRIRSNPAIGMAIGPMGKQAFPRAWVIGGTKPHRIAARRTKFLPAGMGRAVLNPGIRTPNPFVARGMAATEDEAVAIATAHIAREMGA